MYNQLHCYLKFLRAWLIQGLSQWRSRKTLSKNQCSFLNANFSNQTEDDNFTNLLILKSVCLVHDRRSQKIKTWERSCLHSNLSIISSFVFVYKHATVCICIWTCNCWWDKNNWSHIEHQRRKEALMYSSTKILHWTLLLFMSIQWFWNNKWYEIINNV